MNIFNKEDKILVGQNEITIFSQDEIVKFLKLINKEELTFFNITNDNQDKTTQDVSFSYDNISRNNNDNVNNVIENLNNNTNNQEKISQNLNLLNPSNNLKSTSS